VRGEVLEDFIAQNGLSIENNPSSGPTFVNFAGESNIDVTLTLRLDPNHRRYWQLNPDAVVSEHILITLKLIPGRDSLIHTPLSLLPRPFRSGNKEDWIKVKRDLARALDRASECFSDALGNPDRYAEIINHSLISTLERNLGRGRPPGVSTENWWGPMLTRMKTEVNQTRREYRRARRLHAINPTDETALQLNTMRGAWRTHNNRFRATATKARKNSWRKFLTKEGNENPWGKIYKVLKGPTSWAKTMEGIHPIGESSPCCTFADSSRRLLETLIPQDRWSDDTPQQLELRRESRIIPNTGSSPTLTKEEINDAVLELSSGRAPGIDRLTNGIIKRAWSVIAVDIGCLFNLCLTKGCFPACWKTGRLIVIPKDTDRPRSDPKAYRPITLLPALGKLFERIIAARIMSHLSEHAPLSDRQFGFRPGKSTEDALEFAIDFHRTSTKKYIAGVLLDIAGAFDSAWWPAVLAKLKLRRLPADLYALIASYFADRAVLMDAGSEIIQTPITMGCPQGSVLGPLLWNVLFDDVLDLPLPEDCTIIGYADDILVLVGADTGRTLASVSNLVLGRIGDWGRRNKLRFATAKCSTILLKGALQRNPGIGFPGEPRIPVVTSARYLGVILQANFRVYDHVNQAMERAKQATAFITRTLGSSWGLRFQSLKVYYKAIYVPIVSYAAAAIERGCRYGEIKRRLTAGQRAVLLRTTRAYRTSSGASMPVIAGVLPLDLEIQVRAATRLGGRGREATIGSGIVPPPRPDCASMSMAARNNAIKAALEVWQLRWDEGEHGRTTYLFFPQVARRMEMWWVQPDFHVTQFLTGHGAFNAKLASMRLKDDPSCNHCGFEEQTSEHILWSCPSFEMERSILFAAASRGHGPVGHADLVANRPAFRAFCVFAAAVGARVQY